MARNKARLTEPQYLATISMLCQTLETMEVNWKIYAPARIQSTIYLPRSVIKYRREVLFSHSLTVDFSVNGQTSRERDEIRDGEIKMVAILSLCAPIKL